MRPRACSLCLPSDENGGLAAQLQDWAESNDKLRAQLDAAMAENERYRNALSSELDVHTKTEAAYEHTTKQLEERLQDVMGVQSLDAADARKQLHAAMAALRKYGRHACEKGRRDVLSERPYKLTDPFPCTCGLDAALAAGGTE
mgnify:CR=1 FL=1